MAKSYRLLGIAMLACWWLAMPSLAQDLEALVEVDPYLGRKALYEQLWQHKIERLLIYIDGAVVSVDVELTTDAERQVVAESLGEPKVIKTETKSRTNSDSTNKNEADTTSSREADEYTHEESAVPTTQTTTHYVGLVPKRVTVSIAVPRSYVDSILQAPVSDDSAPVATSPISEAEWILKIQRAVNILLPEASPDKDGLDRIVVTVFEASAPRSDRIDRRLPSSVPPRYPPPAPPVKQDQDDEQ